MATYLTSLASLGVVTWFIIAVRAALFWAALVLLGLANLLCLVEKSAAKRLRPGGAKPRFLVGGFLAATTVEWVMAAIVLILIFNRFGTLQLAGTGMSPTLNHGQRILYVRLVEPERLRQGSVIAYKISNRSAWGKPGWLMISRIAAVPGDQLSIREGNYLVNGEVGPAVADTGRYAPVIQIPYAPETISLPANCFFVVQDSPKRAFDGRVFSWVETGEIVGTRLYYLSGRRLLKAVE